MAVTIMWKNNMRLATSIRIYRESLYFLEPNSQPIVELSDPNAMYWVDETAEDGEFWYRIATVLPNGQEAFSEAFLGVTYTGPGSNELIGGDMSAGFFGEVPVSELFTGTELASAIGLSAGTSQNTNEPWLKFVLDGEILYVAKKPYRSSVSWDAINAVNAVYNDSNSPVVSKDGYDFRVTLLRGANEDPSSAVTGNNPEGTELSEWNRLMYKVHVDDPSGEPWANYTNADIIVGAGDGRASWCQETNEANSGQRVYRGNFSLVNFIWTYSSSADTYYGWRPALRLLI